MTQTLPPWIRSKTNGGLLNPVISIKVAQNWVLIYQKTNNLQWFCNSRDMELSLGQGGVWNQGYVISFLPGSIGEVKELN